MLAPLLIVASALLAIDPPATLAELSLPDQHGRSDSLAAHHGSITVAMVVTARRLRNLRPWEQALRERYDDLHLLRVADVTGEPAPTHDQVAAKLRERVPDEISVLIDLDGRWAAELGLDTARPNLLLFDAEGRSAGSFRGRFDPALFDGLCAAIDGLRGRP